MIDLPRQSLLNFDILPQPDDQTCGPTCLHAVYGFWGEDLPIQQVIHEVEPLDSGGTLAVQLAGHALRRGYRATIYTYNLVVFDPTWFRPGVDLADKLRQQATVKTDPKLRAATRWYLEFLALGGQLRLEELTRDLISRPLHEGKPILTGLSATYLYGSAREVEESGLLRYDDVRGEPMGHFVVLCGYDPERDVVRIADPLFEKPRYGGHQYVVSASRLLTALAFGILTYDANLLILEPATAGGGIL
ncbi:MAG TPA: hypothetical protein VJ957_01645 [Longimicrobiales bacterium]|nr:hypothetical protein [Longimicrobiales bacterium]